jgi:ATP-dependent protease ClpP protease subunit
MAEILLYGVIGDPIDELDSKTVVSAIRASQGPLSVRINSPGGYVIEGLAIVEAIRSYPDEVTIYVDGLAASMASVIAMVGAETIMGESALMMIHKPWDASIGNADELRADAARLDRLEAQLINIYVARTGLKPAAIAAMLAAETWMDANQALAAGFATGISQSLKIAAMASAASYGFRNLPDQMKENPMPTAPVDAQMAVAAERERIATIMQIGAKHNVPIELTDRIIRGGMALEQARATILDFLADQSDRQQIGYLFHNRQTLDNPEVYATAIRDAIAGKISGKSVEGPASEFRGMSIVELARDFLARRGERDVTRMSADRVIALAMRPSDPRGLGYGPIATGGLQTTSDFPDLIGSASEKFLIERYQVQQSPLKQLASQRDRSNFLMQYGVQIGGMGALDHVNEGGEFQNRTISTRKEGYALDTYGGIFAVSRQMLVNDALGALTDILIIMAAAAAETEALILAGLINSNPIMGDGRAVFDATHANIAAIAAAPSIASLDAGRMAMRSQKDLDGAHLIDAKPKFLLVPVTLETAAETLIAGTISPTKTADVNPFQGKLEVIADPRLLSTTNWFLFADPNFTPALQYSYLDGHNAPFLDTQDGWRVDGTEYKVRHDFGAGFLDYRMAYKNAGV